MSGELDTLILQSLAEGEKSYGEIFFWIKAKGGSEELRSPYLLSGALEALQSAELIERCTKRVVSEFSGIARPEWIYRLTADGALKQWARQSSVPKEMSSS